MQRTSGPIRWGHTLMELVLACAIVALVSLAGARGLAHHLDRLAVSDAVADAGALMARARDEALARHAIASVRIDTARAMLTLYCQGDRIADRPLGRVHGVSLRASRDSIVFDVRGLGYGAGNLTLVARRGQAADTLVLSRLGRVRY